MGDRRAVFSAALIVFATTLLVLGGAYVVFRLLALLLWVIPAAILATGLRPLVRRLEQTRRLPRAGGDQEETRLSKVRIRL